MLAILTPTSFWFGHPPVLRLDPGASDLRSWTRRLSRTATLDGGAVVTDGGFCQADRSLVLAIRDLTAADADALEAIAAYPECYLACDRGLFRGQVRDLALNGAATARVTFWVGAQIA